VSDVSEGRGEWTRGPAVVDGVLQYVSPSQIVKFDPDEGGCPRAWFYNKVLRRKEPKKKSAEVGKANHKLVEVYLRGGGKVFNSTILAGRRFIPEPGDDLLIEHSIDDGTMVLADLPLVGFMDLFHRRGRTETEAGLIIEPGVVEVLDWKFTGDLKWAKSGEEIGRASPMLAYGAWAALHWPDAERLRLSHVYFCTKKRGAEKSTIILERDDLIERWNKREAVVYTMQQVAGLAEVDQVEANVNACDSFGGCPHREVCTAGKSAGAAQAFGMGRRVDTVSLLKKKANPQGSDVEAAKARLKEEEVAAARAAALAKLPAGFEAAVKTIQESKLGQPALARGAARAWAIVTGLELHGEGLAGSGYLGDPGNVDQIFEPQQVVDLAVDVAELVAQAKRDEDEPQPELPAILPPDAPAPDKATAADPVPGYEHLQPAPGSVPPGVPLFADPATAKPGDLVNLNDERFEPEPVADEQPRRGRPRGTPKKAASAGTAPTITINIVIPESIGQAIGAAILSILNLHQVSVAEVES
jgi:hypothetical protein